MRPWQWLIAPLCCALLLVAACNKSSDTPKTTDTPADTQVFADQVLATLNDEPITMNDLFLSPEARHNLIAVRSQDIELNLIRYRFNKEGLTVDDAAKAAYVDKVYENMGIEAKDGKTRQQVFEEERLANVGIDPETWAMLAETQYMAEELVKKLDPITDEVIQQEFDSIPKEQLLQQFGQKFGWTKPEDVQVEPMKELIRSQLTGERISTLTGDWGKQARTESVLTVNRLPSEALPAADGSAPGAAPETAPPAGEGWKVEPVAYVLNGEEFTWESILNSKLAAEQVGEYLWQPVHKALIEAEWKALGEEIDQADYLEELERSKGGPEKAQEFQGFLASQAMSEAEFDNIILFNKKLKLLLAKKYPVSDAEVEAQFQQLPPQAKMQLAQQLGKSPEDAANLTLDEAKPLVRDMIETQRAQINQGDYMLELVKQHQADGSLKLVDPRLELPEEEPAMDLPPMGEPPAEGGGAINIGEVTPEGAAPPAGE